MSELCKSTFANTKEEEEEKMSGIKELEDFVYVNILPTELLHNIFSYFGVSQLMKCRQVCHRWKSIIDTIACNDNFWINHCQRDFSNCYSIARSKAKPELSWYNLYISLYQWPKLASATEEGQELATASRVYEEIVDVAVLRNGILAVHRKCAIEYYETDTTKISSPIKTSIIGDYSSYSENEYAIVMKSYHPHLFVTKKPKHKHEQKTFENVKTFLLIDAELFMVRPTGKIYVCDISADNITCDLIAQVEDKDGVMCLGYKNRCVNVLTYQRNIYTIVNKKDVVLRHSLNSEKNVLNVIYNYNFLENLDWRGYFQWMFVINLTIPQGPMANIIIIKPYGDIFFVGTRYGQVLIFYKPYINGELDLFNVQPIRLLNFMDITAGNVIDCGILQIDVMETEKGHTVFIAMPKKLVVFRYTHDIRHPESWAMSPCSEWDSD